MDEELFNSEDHKVTLEKPNPEVLGNEPDQGIYREGEFSRQGEYHQNPEVQTGIDGENDTYQQNFYGQMEQEPYQPVSQGFGIASLVLGILSLVLFCSCINIVLAVMAIIFGIIQLTKPEGKKGMAVAGIVTSVISIICFIIFTVTVVMSTDFQEGFQKGLIDGLEGNYSEQYNYRGYQEYDFPDDFDSDFDYFDDFDDTF